MLMKLRVLTDTGKKVQNNVCQTKHVPLTETDDSRTAQCLVNTAGGVVLLNQVFSNSFSPEPLHADEHYHVEE
ncbi:hypothetical protein EVAR_60102_1 [Eumeta japonica]|uniref:Uncharacterized protein n=1 Tax=Eumeta variegata TaxID=151549 RepID=A0A4C1Z7T5_EUMVA|nr:hypothetical protein EVAR_60102_1 [Eumeta japonica]